MKKRKKVTKKKKKEEPNPYHYRDFMGLIRKASTSSEKSKENPKE